MTDDQIIDAVLLEEGGLVDNPADPGGITNRGVTIPAFTDYLRATSGDPGAVATREAIRGMSPETAVAFYRWLLSSSGISRIADPELRYCVFDAAVNLGVKQAVRLLQRSLKVHADGIIGPATLLAIPYLDAQRLARLVAVEQMEFYGRLAAKDLADRDGDGVPDRLEFLTGWLARLARKMRRLA